MYEMTYVELPPRARRIHTLHRLGAVLLGTTSACAENTLSRLPSRKTCWNYLRVRGEYPGRPFGGGQNMELPPRARRIPKLNKHRRRRRWNYLRVRGEYWYYPTP